MILSMPFPGNSSKSKGTVPGENVSLWKNSSLQESPGEKGRSDQTAENGQGEPAVRTAAAKPAADYEKELEERIAQILKSVEGVGKVDVMVVLSSSGEKVYRTDRSENTSTTKEKDASGGERDIASSQSEENTILSQQSGSTGTSPLIQKELYPEISGIVISAQGGDSPTVQAEISQAMEALFGLEPHKIKVLKRVE